jgi:hypothetical protein
VPDKRREPRRAFISRVELQWEDPDGSTRRADAIIEDKSLSGLGMRLHKSIPVGTRVLIKQGTQELGGIVKHCISEGYEYIVGVKLSSVGG